MCETMFEEYGFGGVYVAIQAVLTLYAQGESAAQGHRMRADDQVYKPVLSSIREMVSPTSFLSTMDSPCLTSLDDWMSRVEMSRGT
jgi:actin-related protein